MERKRAEKPGYERGFGACKDLPALWRCVDALHAAYYPGHALQAIHAAGKEKRPRFMLVFINPTARNNSSDLSWKGLRYPFIGTKQVWRVLNRAGFFDDTLLQEIERRKDWSPDFAQRVRKHLAQQDIYITNLVKWTGHDATLPDTKKIALFLPILRREIEIVKPHYIVTFGLIPFQALTEEKLVLGEYYSETMREKRLRTYDVAIGRTRAKIIPCYFPIGRGNPQRAVEMLKIARNME